MIINIQGTHGSGKTTIVKSVIDHFPEKIELWERWHRHPSGYLLRHPERQAPVYVPGHYCTPCGGCDSFVYVDEMYIELRKHAREGCDVLFEGVVAQHAMRDLYELREWKPIILIIDIDDADAIAAVNERRAKRGKNPKPVNGYNIEKENRLVHNREAFLRAGGFDVRHITRDAGLSTCLELLKV